MLIGAEIKGGNPKISAGAEFQLSQLRINLNYTLDLTSSVTPLNRISLSGKIMLGDRGRHIIDQQVDEYYMEGLKLYSNAQWQEAIQIWEQVLKLNKRFDPAILGIESARAQIDMFENIKNSLKLEYGTRKKMQFPRRFCLKRQKKSMHYSSRFQIKLTTAS